MHECAMCNNVIAINEICTLCGLCNGCCSCGKTGVKELDSNIDITSTKVTLGKGKIKELGNL